MVNYKNLYCPFGRIKHFCEYGEYLLGKWDYKPSCVTRKISNKFSLKEDSVCSE